MPIPPSNDKTEADSLVCYYGANKSDSDVDDINKDYESNKDGPVMYGQKNKITVLPMEETCSTVIPTDIATLWLPLKWTVSYSFIYSFIFIFDAFVFSFTVQ
jgi:hypothetical protein